MRGTWYQFAATFGRSREGYLTLVPLTGSTGGMAMDPLATASGLRVVDGIAGCGEAGDDPHYVALGDAQRRGDLTQAHPRVAGDADEGPGTGWKAPPRHEIAVDLFQKFVASFLVPA
jgi:hypothetical protein